MQIETSASIIAQFRAFSEEKHSKTGKPTGTPSSYVNAIKTLSDFLKSKEFFLTKRESTIWDVLDTNRLNKLYVFLVNERNKSYSTFFASFPEKCKSYWTKGYCSAAIKEFIEFLEN